MSLAHTQPDPTDPADSRREALMQELRKLVSDRHLRQNLNARHHSSHKLDPTALRRLTSGIVPASEAALTVRIRQVEVQLHSYGVTQAEIDRIEIEYKIQRSPRAAEQ